MQYIGSDRKIRLYKCGNYYDNNPEDRYLLDKDLMMDYLTDPKYDTHENSNGSRNGKHWIYSELSPDEKMEVYTYIYPKEDFLSRHKYELFSYKDKNYIKMFDYGKKGDTTVFEILPQIYNDKIFCWIKNKKYNTLETTLVLGNFEFYCICDNNNNVAIDVKYTKCDNRHKNRVTISVIKINDADNETILNAIDFWKEQFVKELNEIA